MHGLYAKIKYIHFFVNFLVLFALFKKYKMRNNHFMLQFKNKHAYFNILKNNTILTT